jgi:hypothetical protein
LDSDPDNLYNIDPGASFEIRGRRADGDGELWQAVRFMPKTDVRAQVLRAAVQYESGTKLVRMGLYTNDEVRDSVGTLLPGGEGSTSEMPDDPTCCDLTTVLLPGDGVVLSAHTFYWLAVTIDNTAQDFDGHWRFSNRAQYASFSPPFPWRTFPGAWPAAQIEGVTLEQGNSSNIAEHEEPRAELDGPEGSNIIIYNSLGPANDRYLGGGAGLPISGSDAISGPEIWQALPFTPKTDVHVKTIGAAIGHEEGTPKIILGIYTDSGGTVGAPLPGGQGSTTDIPGVDECCELAKVTLPDPGLALSANVQVWLVASTADPSDFSGVWKTSTRAVRAYQDVTHFGYWVSGTSFLLAAQIRGTSP